MTERVARSGALAAVGLGALEEDAYRTVISLRSTTPTVLARHLGITASQSADIIGTLIEKGLVTQTASTPPRLVATPVDIASGALLLSRFNELQAARAEFAELADDYRAAGPYRSVDELVEIVDGNAVPALFAHLQRQAVSEVLIVTTPPYAVATAHNAVEFAQLANDITYRSLYTHEALEQPAALDDLQRFVQAGEQARVIPGAVRKMAIFDRKIAMLPVGGEPVRTRSMPPRIALIRPELAETNDCLLIHESAMLSALVELFERLWLTAVPVDTPAADTTITSDPGDRSISAAESRLLAMLVVGMTDDAIGRQLGLARRTVVRRVHQLMTRAKAGNRLQLVLRAAQLGWIDIERGERAAAHRTAQPTTARPSRALDA